MFKRSRLFISAKSLFILTALCILSVSASASSETVAAAFIKGLADRDRAVFDRLFAEEIVYELPMEASGETADGSYRRFTGRTQALAYIDQIFGRIQAVRFEAARITQSADGRTAFLEGRGDMLLVGSRAAYRNIYIIRFDVDLADRIIGVREIFNPVTAALAFGRPIGPQR